MSRAMANHRAAENTERLGSRHEEPGSRIQPSCFTEEKCPSEPLSPPLCALCGSVVSTARVKRTSKCYPAAMGFSIVEFESTPNPNALKIWLDKPISDRPRSFLNAEMAAEDPIASALFQQAGVVTALFNG